MAIHDWIIIFFLAWIGWTILLSPFSSSKEGGIEEKQLEENLKRITKEERDNG
jgi:threonine/homoserine/homoserine lactone efflux protein